jgi:hypothetical protein
MSAEENAFIYNMSVSKFLISVIYYPKFFSIPKIFKDISCIF